MHSTNLKALAQYYEDIGDYDTAERLLTRALEADEKHFGARHPVLAEDLFNLGLLLFSAEKYFKAEKMLQRALNLQTKALGAEHPDVKETIDVLTALRREREQSARLKTTCDYQLASGVAIGAHPV